jgi:flagellar motor protein MotB
MMSLLLCFFVLIVSFSEIKKDEQYQAIVAQIQQAFGPMGGGGKVPITDDPTMSLIKRLDAMRLRQERIPNRSNTKDPGQQGREPKVTKVREGLVIGAGGRVTFEPGSAILSDLSAEAVRELVVSAQLEGTNNILEIRGHASAMELPPQGNEEFRDVWDLSHARAKAVFRLLTEELKFPPDRFRITANGAREPLDNRAYSTGDDRLNRRVEVLVSETLVEEMQVPEKTGV